MSSTTKNHSNSRRIFYTLSDVSSKRQNECSPSLINKENDNEKDDIISDNEQEKYSKNLCGFQKMDKLHSPSISSSPNDDTQTKLMEKDKIIFEYSKLLKETERVLENTQKLNSVKEEAITKMKDELKECKFQKKNLENLLQKNEEELAKYQNSAEEQIILLSQEKQMIENQFDDLKKLYAKNQSDFQSSLEEYKTIEKQLSKLKVNFDEKDNIIKNYEKVFEELKRENKVIPSLKKKISEMDSIISEQKLEGQSIKASVEKINAEKDEIENKFRLFLEESKQDKEMSKTVLKMSYEIESLKKELDEKVKDNSAINEKYRNILKENDTFIQIITSEIVHFTNSLEDFNLASIAENMDSCTYSTKEPKTNLPQLSLKYELVSKNIDILKTKVLENRNHSLNVISKLDKANSELEKQNREIVAEKDSLLKENSILKPKLSEITERFNDLQKSHEKLTDSHRTLKETHVKLKTSYEDMKKKCDNICNETQTFLNNCYVKLKEKFPEMESGRKSGNRDDLFSDNLNFSEKILHSLDSLTEDYNKMVSHEKEYIEKDTMSQLQIKNLLEEKDIIISRMERLSFQKENEIRKAEAGKADELKRQREVLYEKIKSLTSLLEESNQMINLYECENKEMKEKISRLEYNLRMLTISHIELENSINDNTTTLQNANDEKEYKYNSLLREIELKDIHIRSLEKLIQQNEEEITTLKENNEQNRISTTGSGADGRACGKKEKGYPTNEKSFFRNEENERELHKLIASYSDQDNEAFEIASKTHTQSEKINEVNNSHLSIKHPQRTPGKIYSVKRK